jgi:hypothetical protein
MKLDIAFLLVALALLLPPMPMPAALRKTLVSSRRPVVPNPLHAAYLWQNWVDLLRAALGVFILTQAAILPDPEVEGGQFRCFVVIGSLLGCGLLLQTIRIGVQAQFLVPVFYLCGLTLVLPGIAQGAFGAGVGWLFAVAGKNLAYQVPAMALALIAAGFVLGHNIFLLLNFALILLPLVISVLFTKRLQFAVHPGPGNRSADKARTTAAS